MKKFYYIFFLLLPSFLFSKVTKETLINNFDQKEKIFNSTVKYLKIETFTKFDYGEVLYYNSTVENFIDSLKILSLLYDTSFKDTIKYFYTMKKNSPLIKELLPEENNLIINPENIFKGFNFKYLLPDTFTIEDDGKNLILKNVKKNEILIYIKLDRNNLSLKELSLKNIYDQVVFKVITNRYLKNGIILPDSYEIEAVNMKTKSYSKIKNLTVEYR
uniref:Uncharacterized protein n=1 Tax=candidate division WOR-3 bacterium TaxID=2052148 RepID=A0A7C3J6D4_UNCW3